MVRGARSAGGRRAAAAIRRHRIAVGVALVALVVVLVAVPTTAPSPPPPPSGAVVVPAGVTPPTPAYGAGRTVAGLACGPGVRQVTWSAYAPPCQPAWHGSNGGATARGVSATTIRISVRQSGTDGALDTVLLPAVVGTDAQQLATLQAYVKVFNRTFELYGRRVVLVPYVGKGDVADEALGQGQVAAEQDAVTVAGTLGAFGDLTLTDGSAVYSAALAAEGVVNSSLWVASTASYQANAPWDYAPGASCTKGAAATAAVLGRQLAGLDAVDGGPAVAGRRRSFGVVYPEAAQSALCAQQVLADLAASHVAVRQQVAVLADPSQLADEAANAVAQLAGAGVTTVACAPCDPTTIDALMTAAQAQGYQPEWWLQPSVAGGQVGTDALTRALPAAQASHLLSLGNQDQPFPRQEAVRAYELGTTDARVPPAPSYTWAYQAALQLFDGLQLAGPDLTAANLEAAMGRIPPSAAGGMFGSWRGSAGPWDPASGYRVVKWFADRTSPTDGRPGTWVACDGDREFSYAAAGRDVPVHTALVCSPSAASAADRRTP